MSNVIPLPVPRRITDPGDRLAAICACFAEERRAGEDVFWLKETAELLNVLETSGASLPDHALAAFRPFYDGLEARLEFFPQYYRFLLSIALDLEALGLEGETAEHLVAQAARADLPGAELSDLQRMEARRLMARRGVEALPEDAGLEARMRRFIARSDVFALPNKKAAYELTHVVFYLSEYGRRDPALCEGAITSLRHVGHLAWLERNADLMAECCAALRFAGVTPPMLWTRWLADEVMSFRVEAGPSATLADDYHVFLVCHWHRAIAEGRPCFDGVPVMEGRMAFLRGPVWSAPLKELSRCLYDLGAARSGDWQTMRPILDARLTDGASDTLAAASEIDGFERFFHLFARSGPHDTGLASLLERRA
ncbi:DUF6902 family protein [Litorisediminicola beolgyonensis]|uniref:DUF6902 family protein n=1 Tax=Litorisediminicola beolgyonensis TaxID=1173614 RepID=A0ABW3ZLC7_9RHOB